MNLLVQNWHYAAFYLGLYCLSKYPFCVFSILLYFSLTIKATTLIFITRRGSAISSAKEGKSGFSYNLVKS